MNLYNDHFETITQRFSNALTATHNEGVVIHSGSPQKIYLDDQSYPYKVNPHFAYWVPMTDCPDSFIAFKPGQKPLLIVLQANDFWHTQPQLNQGPWLELFDTKSVPTLTQAEQLLADYKQCAWLGDTPHMPSQWGFETTNPEDLLAFLHYERAQKTDWEIELLTTANNMAARSHLAARDAFLAGASEIDIHNHYLLAMSAPESALPYSSIVALNNHGAVLHYDRYETIAPDQSIAFLIDAGARHHGYVADITRTWTTPEHSEFQQFIDRITTEQLALIETLKVGSNYASYHYDMHTRLADVLSDFKLINCSAEEALATNVTKAFFPHGLGHLIGLQTHDVAGHQLDHQGTEASTSDGHPFLRLRREITEGMAFTIEPGCYVIDQLLAEHTGTGRINQARVDWLRPYGGVRIEDTVVMKDHKPVNITLPGFNQHN